MADKHEVNGIARGFCLLGGELRTKCVSVNAEDIACKTIKRLAKGEGNSERPDATITVDGITIGIEHFKLFPETSRKGDKLEQALSRDRALFDKAKAKHLLQVGPIRQYHGEKVTINGMEGRSLDNRSDDAKLKRLLESFGKVYTEHANNIAEYRKNIDAASRGKSKLVFLVECANFELLRYRWAANPYYMPGFRNIIRGCEDTPDYIAFYMYELGNPVIYIIDTSADAQIPCYCTDNASVNIPFVRALRFNSCE